MFGFARKLDKWEEAGLITQDQKTAIYRHEKDRKSNRLVTGVIGLALFAIVVGVLSIIAANWYNISGEIKIFTHVVINIVLAYFVYKKEGFWREGATLLLFGLTLTLIVLIGQVYQLGGSWSGALLLWMVATFPLIFFYGERRITGWPWVLSLLATIQVVLFENLEFASEFWVAYLVVSLAVFLPLVFIFVSQIKSVKKWKVIYANIFSYIGILLILIAATIIPSLVYFDGGAFGLFAVRDYYLINYLTFNTIFLVAAIAMYIYVKHLNFYADNEEKKYLAILVFGSLLTIALPFLIPHLAGSTIAALHFIAFWLFVGWAAQNLGRQNLVTLSIILIAIRIFAIYVELFGSLLNTGVSLILGGVVMLALMWGAKKINSRLKKERSHV